MHVCAAVLRLRRTLHFFLLCLWTLGHFWAIGRKRHTTLTVGTLTIILTGPTKEVSFGVFIIDIVIWETYLLLDRLHIHLSIEGHIWINNQRLIQSPNAHAHSNPGSGAAGTLNTVERGIHGNFTECRCQY